MSLLVASWNINSIRSRLEILDSWLRAESPDILLIQETKCEEKNFPYLAFEALPYNITHVGQKAYNGVAIFSKEPVDIIHTKLPYDDDDAQARYVEVFTSGYRFGSVYVPNGSELGSEKFAYKLKFYERLKRYLQEVMASEEKYVLGGDFNVAPTDEDVYDPNKYQNRILVSPQEREAFRRLTNMGMVDAIRGFHPYGEANPEDLFTWWDYRKGSWPNNQGLRIDHFLLTPEAADCLEDAYVDRDPRGLQRPSDHTPVLCRLKL